MMKKIIEYLKVAIFVVGVLVGIQVPTFVTQYGQSLDARLAESEKTLAEFQQTANTIFGGSLPRLIHHYLNSGDEVFVQGGRSLVAISERNSQLQAARAEFNRSLTSAYWHVLVNPIAEVRQDVWRGYQYAVVLNQAAIVFGIVMGLLLMALLELVFVAVAVSLKKLLQKKLAQKASV